MRLRAESWQRILAYLLVDNDISPLAVALLLAKVGSQSFTLTLILILILILFSQSNNHRKQSAASSWGHSKPTTTEPICSTHTNQSSSCISAIISNPPCALELARENPTIITKKSSPFGQFGAPSLFSLLLFALVAALASPPAHGEAGPCTRSRPEDTGSAREQASQAGQYQYLTALVTGHGQDNSRKWCRC